MVTPAQNYSHHLISLLVQTVFHPSGGIVLEKALEIFIYLVAICACEEN